MKNLKLEVGKTYRNRKGKEVRIVKRDSEPFPYLGDNKSYYAKDGSFWYSELPQDLIEKVEEVPETRHTFAIPEGVKQVTVEQVGNCIVVEMVPEAKEPKPGDVLVNEQGSVYIFKEVTNYDTHRHYAWLGENGRLSIGTGCLPGRPATPEEAQPLWDALKKAGKRWNAETMQVEDVPERDRIREWMKGRVPDGYYTYQGIAYVIENYLKYREGEK